MKWLMPLLIVLLLSGCKGSDGDDGSISVTMTANTAFKNEAFALGCFVVSESETSCVCYESGTSYYGAASGSTTCKGYANDLTMVVDGTTLLSVAEGAHNYCLTTVPSNDCSSVTGSVSLTANSGESGSSTALILPEDGDDGDAKSYTLTFTPTSASVNE